MNFEAHDNEPINVHNITTFVNDDTSKTAHKREEVSLISSILETARINDEQDLKSFLGRPVVLQDGLLTNTDAVTTFSPVEMLDAILQGTMVSQKLIGFGGIRGDAILTLQINATRFTQGRYLLNFYPTGGAMDDAHANLFNDCSQFTWVQRTSVPGIQIDLNSETQVQLRIPFMSAYAFNPIRSATSGNNIRNIGYARIHPYAAASSNTSYTLYGHLENVELFLPTVPQADTSAPTDTEKEQKSKDIGPVESAAKVVTKVTKLFKNVPILSSYVEPIGWAADLVGGVAGAFGWSKPTISDTVMILARNRGYQNPNVDGADVGVKMSLSVKNQVATVPGLGATEVDEMSFDYIKTIPAWFNTVTWNTSTAKENLLTNISLSPFGFPFTTSDNSNSTINFQPCTSPAIFFNQYRGSFKVTIKAVKTEFHSGRLAVCFVPQILNGLSLPTINYASTYFTNRHIIDLRTAKEWTFEFPFGSEFTYLPTTTQYGSIYIYIENQLVAPATVPSQISLILEVSGGDDLEFAQPSPITYSPYHPTAPQADVSAPGLVSMETPVLDTAVGGTQDEMPSVNFAEISIGEKFTSYRQLVKRMDLRGRSAAVANVNNQYVRVMPFGRDLVEGLGTASMPTFPTTQPDTFSIVSSMFAIGRGSVRIKLYQANAAASGACFAYVLPIGSNRSASVDYNTVDTSGKSGPGSALGAPCAQVPISDGITAEVQIPMYSGAFGFSCADTAIYPSYGYPAFNTSAPAYSLNVSQYSPANTVTTQAPFVMRGAGDDFSLHCFVAVPPMIATSTTYSSAGWG